MKYKHVALLRFLISLILASICYSICASLRFDTGNTVELSWISFGLSYLIQGVFAIFRMNSTDIKQHAKDEDLGIWLQFVVLIIGCTASLLALVFWDKNDSLAELPKQLLFIVSVTLSWFIVHLSFTFRYAHLYYGDLNSKYQRHAGGLDFPDEDQPDYFDFAYYSYTIGMTFQVSDVTVKTKGLRRLTLVHSLISFVFNTILVALTINEILK